MKEGARDIDVSDTGSVIITPGGGGGNVKPNGGDIDRPIDGDISEKDYGF